VNQQSEQPPQVEHQLRSDQQQEPEWQLFALTQK
jgi:hypothetical protein